MPSSSLPTGESSRRSFSLIGPGVPLDPRVNAVRRDLADIRLAQYVFAPHYAAPMACIANRRTDILPAADPGGEALSEILPGETFELFEISRTFGWGMCGGDGSVGFVERAALDVAETSVAGQPAAHEKDFVAVAEALLGTPFRAGGRSALGVDQGGLVFYALDRAGIRALRFVDLQAETIGRPVGDEPPARGDIVFFAGHAAIMTDATNAIFVAPGMTVSRLPLEQITARDGIGEVVARRRP